MATISHLPFSLYRKPLFYYHHQQPQFLVSYLNLTTKKNGFVCFACSIKQTRVRKRVKSNEEIRSEIMEFVALTGLPEGHVPSMKELSAHGRVDLANIVRRRGYKFIKELLANSNIEDLVNTNMETSASGICLEDSLTEGQGKEALDVVDRNLSTEQSSSAEMYITATDGSMSLDQSIANSSPEVVTLGSVSEDESSLARVSSHLGEITEKDLKNESVELENRAEIEESSSEGSVSANHSLVFDDTSSCSEREVDNVLVIEDEEVYNVNEASILENHSLVLDETSSCSDRDDVNVVVTDGDELNDVDEASISANHSLVLDDTSNCSDTEAEYVVVIEDEEVNDVDKASISEVSSLVLDDTLSCSDTEAENVLVTEDEEVNDVDEASISEELSLVLNDTSSCSDTEAENVSMTEDDEEINNVEEVNDHYTSPDLNYTNHVYIASQPLSASLDSENSSSTSSIEEKTTRFIQNGYLDTVDDDEDDIPNESYGGQRSVSRPLNGSALALEEDERDGNADLDNELHDETMERENQVEITRLRFMLRQKELELSKLKEEIEKEKLSLSVLQREAETEINKAQMLISEKDAELQEAEESLSGLQEVEIEYCGDGNVVEVTGSFNGWQHRVGMELQASKSIGKQKCWSTLLWLYPGTYEIKFVVDDQWVTNPQMDSVTRGHITNNILKVDK